MKLPYASITKLSVSCNYDAVDEYSFKDIGKGQARSSRVVSASWTRDVHRFITCTRTVPNWKVSLTS